MRSMDPEDNFSRGYRSIEATQARQLFREVIDEATVSGRRVVITRHGRPVAAIVAMRDLEQLKARDASTDAAMMAATLGGSEASLPLEQLGESTLPYDLTLRGIIEMIRGGFDEIYEKKTKQLEVVFILNEFNDLHEPYFGLAKHIVSRGCSIIYTSDERSVVQKVPELHHKLANEKIIDLAKARELIRTATLPDYPQVTNLCFIVSRGVALAGYSAYTVGGSTIGGAQLSDEKTRREWEDYRNALNRSAA